MTTRIPFLRYTGADLRQAAARARRRARWQRLLSKLPNGQTSASRWRSSERFNSDANGGAQQPALTAGKDRHLPNLPLWFIWLLLVCWALALAAVWAAWLGVRMP